MLDDADGRRQALGQLRRIVELACEIRDDAAVGAPWHVPELRGPESAQRPGEAELEELERNRR